MDPNQPSPSPSPLQDIPRWTQAYAKNRVLTGGYVMGVCVALMAGCFLAPQLGGYFRRAGHFELATLCVGLFWVFFAGLGVMVLVVEASKLKRFGEELERVPCSAWGDLVAAFRAAGPALSIFHFVVWLIICPLLLLGSSDLLRAGRQLPAYVRYGLNFLALGALMVAWMSRQRSGLSAYWTRLGRWISPGEGVAEPTPPKTLIWADYLVGFAFLFGVQATVLLGLLGKLRLEWMQPVSALYCVPLLIYGALRFNGGIWPWLYAALYALHAILVVAGAPILFRGEWHSLNMLLPVGGYGILSALVAHAYGRRALRKLKALAALPSGTEGGEGACEP
jgi:hypothetical protein